MTAPLLLLDVDGVLNALGRVPRDVPGWRHGRATADGTSWPITWLPSVVERLVSLHEEGRLELQWLTTWGHDANLELRALLGMPLLTVAGTHQDEPEDGTAADAGPAHAAVAPSAPSRDRWWKHDVVQRLLREQPGRLLVWVDDELHDPLLSFRRWADEHPLVLPVGPDPRTGLLPADLAYIEEAL